MNIPQYSPSLGPEERAAVLQVLDDNWLTEGPRTAALEARLRELTGARHVHMMPNGTLALFAALKLLGIGPGDEVLVPDFTFFASASAVLLCGATPVLVDVQPDDYHIDLAAARTSLSSATRAILPVHIYGQACDMDAVMTFAAEFDLRVVEDAAQGAGVRCRGRHVGTFGHIGCLSLFADKTVTTGEGGALLIQDDELAQRALYFKNQGRRERGSFIHPEVGFNFRITDLQSAIGVVQLARLGEIVQRKRHILERYRRGLAGVAGVEFPAGNGLGEAVPFRINILVQNPESLGDALGAAGVCTRRFFYPLHRQPALRTGNCVVRQPPVHSTAAFQRGLSLPSGIALTGEQIDFVCRQIRKCLDAEDSR